ncbi:MAG: hypothetical protein J7L98_04935 [Candidatus Verstraetearchaeota archaeon]|nr:hypothetical protein [Candidatus Verstraetearchaeota archaeon]
MGKTVRLEDLLRGKQKVVEEILKDLSPEVREKVLETLSTSRTLDELQENLRMLLGVGTARKIMKKLTL